MGDRCGFCNEEITEGGFIKSSNLRFSDADIKIINFVNKTEYDDICQKCGSTIVNETFSSLKFEKSECSNYVNNNIVDFPMMTIGNMPFDVRFRVKSMVTANVSVGTGIFNEVSQIFSDAFGETSTNSGMALKVNSGESTARAILVNKALNMKANCIIGVDIDYGTTSNNAATVNMQGTAVIVENLEAILATDSLEQSKKLESAFKRVQEINRLLKADFRPVL